jgi:hypothetical protein
MTRSVWIAADTLGYRAGAGHLWAYLNWALGLQHVGCDIVWMEPCRDGRDEDALQTLAERLHDFGLERICLFSADGGNPTAGSRATVAVEEAEGADLLLNLAYEVPRPLLARFARSALLDIDPGMTQTWVAAGDVELAPHDVYLTTGEGVAMGTAPVPDCAVRWLYVPPCVSVDVWTAAPPPAYGAYTTITHWWGDGSFVMPDGQVIDNTKRSAFLRYLTVPRRAAVEVDLAVAADDLEDDAELLAKHGWSFTDPLAAAGTPELYRSYIARSRGEFSCAKPAYVALSTGWISDRTVCYLASGRPAVVQDTGPCGLLDDAQGQGVFRFSDPDGAAAALAAVEQDHPRQCALARSVAEEYFDARRSAARLLELCLP